VKQFQLAQTFYCCVPAGIGRVFHLADDEKVPKDVIIGLVWLAFMACPSNLRLAKDRRHVRLADDLFPARRIISKLGRTGRVMDEQEKRIGVDLGPEYHPVSKAERHVVSDVNGTPKPGLDTPTLTTISEVVRKRSNDSEQHSFVIALFEDENCRSRMVTETRHTHSGSRKTDHKEAA
jgi:hypothetical protein